MTKIAIAGGHSKAAPGASKYIDEYTEDRRVVSAMIAEAARRGYSTANCSNEDAPAKVELATECRLANESKADYFCAVHFNACKTTSAKVGVEVWYYRGSAAGKKLASEISAKLAKLMGLPNRGAKASRDLWVINGTRMTAVLVETCFVDSKADTAAYKAVGPAKVAAAILDGFDAALGRASANAPKPAPSKPATPPSPKKLDVDGKWGKDTTRALQRALGTVVDGIVSDQYAGHRANNPGLTIGWEWHSKTGSGSPMIKALQRKIGAKADGFIGPNTIKQLQNYLGTYADGRIDNPSACVKALQRRLNAGTF